MAHTTRKIATALLLLAPFVATGAHAAATSLEQLLEQVRNARAEESKENTQRELEFKTSRDKQAALLQQAERELAAAEAESARLSAEFDANEVTINEQTTLLRQREGNMGELFGVTRQVAGDTANNIEQSIISAQMPGRTEFLRGLAGAKALPSIAELERLWLEMQNEMTESGRVVRYNGKIVLADGSTQPAKVTRVGPFAASSGGEFLIYQPSLEALSVLPKQGQMSAFRSAARNIEEATEGYVRGVADPGRGVIFGLYSQRPDIWERIEQGEFVGYVIIAVGLLGIALWVYQLVYLVMVRLKVAAQLKNLDKPNPDNPLGRVMLAFKGDKSRIEEDFEIAELRISESTAREIPLLERFQPFLRLAVAAGPLLGLIGTVIGMIITFQAITESGSSDPKLMAQGIGQAMIATVLGLGIAIPLLFANAVLSSLSRGLVQMLDEQSNGMLAESIERSRRA
jgi:biopolymer transport protein ExbB